MEKPKIVIIEDEFVIVEDIRTKLEEEGYDVIGTFDNGETALPFLFSLKPDIVLVDIKLAGSMNGIQMVKELQLKIRIPFIYITANSDHATYELAKSTRPNAFLIKPFTPVNLLAALDLALYNFSIGIELEKIERSNFKLPASEIVVGDFLFVKANNRYKKIHCDDILFAEAAGSYVHVQTIDQRYTLSQNLAHFLKKSPLPNLIRIHRSYIINLHRVESFDDSSVFIQNHKLPLSEAHRAEFMDRIHLL
ncbi:hypothetical protein WSM22_24770 [Cytophagales bacterium WSM2-2]|nr:hypothetical protein WSM22_24770 [Cytophagales bacterium WSM2-2]